MYSRLYYRPIPEVTEPPWRLTSYGPIIDEAGQFLSRKNESDLRMMTEGLNRLLARLYWSAFREATEGQKLGEARDTVGPAACLWQRINHVNLAKQPGLEQATWPEVFAAIALLYSMRAIVDRELVDAEKWQWRDASPPQVFEHAETLKHAAEAIALAKACFDTDPTLEKERTKALDTQKRRSAAIKGHAPKHRVHAAFQAFWIQNSERYKYKSDAAWDFYTTLTDDDKVVVAKKSPNPEHPESKKQLRRAVVKNLVPVIKEL